MKTLMTAALIIIGTLTSFGGNGKEVNNTGCLEVSLHVTYGKKTPKGTKVEVYEGNTVVYSSTEPEYFYFFKFWLKRDKEYTVVVSSEGFHSKKFSVNTWIPSSISQKMAYQLLKQVELVPEVVSYDPAFDHLADEKFAFNPENRLFSNDMDYAAYVRTGQLNLVAKAELTGTATYVNK